MNDSRMLSEEEVRRIVREVVSQEFGLGQKFRVVRPGEAGHRPQQPTPISMFDPVRVSSAGQAKYMLDELDQRISDLRAFMREREYTEPADPIAAHYSYKGSGATGRNGRPSQDRLASYPRGGLSPACLWCGYPAPNLLPPARGQTCTCAPVERTDSMRHDMPVADVVMYFERFRADLERVAGSAEGATPMT